MLSIFMLQLYLPSSLWLILSSSSLSSASSVSIAMPNCRDHCGDVQIPYPFGIGANCFHDESYEIICDNSSSHPKLILKLYDLEVTDIKWIQVPEGSPFFYYAQQQQQLTVSTQARSICGSNHTALKSANFRGSPYRYSTESNVFMVEGCSGSVVLTDGAEQILTGCASLCPSNTTSEVNASHCYGEGCCQSKLRGLPSPTGVYNNRKGLDFYEIFLDQEGSTSSNGTCTLVPAFIKSDSVEKFAGRLSNLSSFPTVVEWRADYLSSETHYSNFSCDYDGDGVQACYCNRRYSGLNPLLPYGCQVVPECQKCVHRCGYNDTTFQYYCEKKLWLKQPPVLGFGIGMGFVLLVLGSHWLYRLIKWRREIKRKAKYFKRNGGLLLQQQMSSSDDVVEKMTVFDVTELEKATDDFHENRVLGQGGQGTVYKGMLTDGRLVAIKKSKEVDEGQLDQFINEVVILSQVNHRRVVKLLGCCLETEVPMLVYEFIPNGTLYQHIHHPTEDFHVTWKMRLQIAAESAGAIAYLHSSSSVPIYHRDIKSSNILLDEKYRAKVSDFGTSRSISIEQTHVTTCVQGTYGYLDPEYFQSHQFTEKSDVYSFGVVLVELVTGKKPIYPTESVGWKSLAVEFLYQMENSRLLDIVDTRVIEEGKEEEFIAVADLAQKCLNMSGKQRPTMKEVAMVLDRIRSPKSNVNGKCVVTEIDDSGPSSIDRHVVI